MWQCSDSKHEVDLFEKMGCIILPTRLMSQIFLFFSEPSTFPTHKFLFRIESELTGPSNDWLQGCLLFFLLPSARLLSIGQFPLHQPGYSSYVRSLSISQATLQPFAWTFRSQGRLGSLKAERSRACFGNQASKRISTHCVISKAGLDADQTQHKLDRQHYENPLHNKHKKGTCTFGG